MLYTLSDARNFVNSFVLSGGSCPNKQIVVDRVNEAVRRLLVKADWKYTQRLVRFKVQNNCLTCPPDIKAIRLVCFDSSPRMIFGNSYEFVDGGPGDIGNEHYGLDLMDLGIGFPTLFDPPHADEYDSRLVFFSTEESDALLSATVYGTTKDKHEEAMIDGVSGETVRILRWKDGVEGTARTPLTMSEYSYSSLSGVMLPAGRKGYVSMYSIDPETSAMYFLAKYHPRETRPGYRRYKIKGVGCGNEQDVCVYAMCKLAYVPAVSDTDILLIQNLDAVKDMVIAIREENAGNIQGAVTYEAQAVRLLMEEEGDMNRGQDVPIMVRDDLSPGYVQTLQ